MRLCLQWVFLLLGIYFAGIWLSCSRPEDPTLCHFALVSDGYPLCSVHYRSWDSRHDEERRAGLAYHATVSSFGIRVGMIYPLGYFIPAGTPRPIRIQLVLHREFGQIPMYVVPFVSASLLILAAYPLLRARLVSRWVGRLGTATKPVEPTGTSTAHD